MVSLENFLQLEDFNGVPLAAGKIYVYHQGRTELAEIYSDINGETPIANPAVLDDLGMQEIYVSNVYNYTVVVTDPYNNELFTRDIYPNGVDGDGNNRLYEGIDPIVVNNDKMAISAKKATLSVQDPLYFVEDSPTAVCIGLQESAYSGLPYVENSAIGYGMAGMQPYVSSISGLGFYALSADSASIAASASLANSAENAGLVTDGWETGSDGRITAYNGTAFSAGKVYSGISPVYVDNENDQIGVSSKDFIANSPLYFTEYSDRVELSISGLPPTPGLMYESGFNYESGKITGYNGSGISAGKVYSGIDPVHVDNVNDTISLDSATLGVQAPLYFVEDSESATIIGVDTASFVIDIPQSADWQNATDIISSNSGNWEDAYSTVNNNSGDWQSAADELAVLNTAKWEGAADTLSSHSGNWESKLDSAIYAADSGNFYTKDNPSGFITGVDLTDYATKDFVNDNVASSISGKLDIATYSSESANFLTGLPSDLVYTADLEAVSAEITGMIPTALTGDYIETSAMKSAQVGTSALITGFYDGQISAASAYKAYSATRAVTADKAGSANSASYVYSGWGVIPPILYHTDSSIKQYYAVTGSTMGFPAGTLYKFNAYSADSASEAASAEKAEKDSLGNIIAMTYLTANQPIPESADWNSAASTVSAGYTLWDASYAVLTSNSANWDTSYVTLTANSAGWDRISELSGYSASGWDVSILNTTRVEAGQIKFTPISAGPQTTAYFGVHGTAEKSPFFYVTNGQIWLYNQSRSPSAQTIRPNDIVKWNNYGSGKLDATATANFYTTANESGFITAVPAGTMNESNFGYDTSNNITAYNGSAFKAGDEFPQSATDAINVVTGGSANWNSTTATVSTNSGAWGGSGIEISAGFGINIQLIDNKLVFSLATATGDI